MTPNSKLETRNSPLDQSRQATLAALTRVDTSTLLQLSQLTLPEIQGIQQEIAQVLPAGNLPALVLSGLAKLKGRVVGAKQVKQDLAALARGVEHLVAQGIYGLFAGPAIILHVYQKLLELAGQDPASAFPQGTWQFYLQFGLREDAARHTCETIGFHQSLPSCDLQRATCNLQAAAAWVCAALELLYRYDDLLAADWAEHVMLWSLGKEVGWQSELDAPPVCARLVEKWNGLRPYHRPPDGSDYIAHREASFQRFLQAALADLPPEARERVHRHYQARLAEELPAYQEQMTVLAVLQPERYQEQKELLPLWQVAVAFIWQGRSYLLPACQRDELGSPLCFRQDASPLALYALPDGQLCDAAHQAVRADRCGRVWYAESSRLLGRLRPPAPQAVIDWLAAIFSTGGISNGDEQTDTLNLDLLLAASPRAMQGQLREKLPPSTQAELAALRRAPIVLNWDLARHDRPLACIRRRQRGIGDHALTIFRTESSFVFDQSHIFFDGVWGMAVAEILTNSAFHTYRRLETPASSPKRQSPLAPLALGSTSEVEKLALPYLAGGEAAAESDGIDMHKLARLRQWLQQRGVRLTINDLLLLYRSFHAGQYQPSPPIRQALKGLEPALRQFIEETLANLRETNPALLIPMDASNVSPRERIFPTTFRNPLTEIGDKFACTQEAYLAQRAWPAFDQARRELLAYLKAFGELLDAYKAVTMRGESFSTATIRLMAHLPASMQHALDQIPQRIGVLNEIIKGNEVFSNVGRVAPGSSLARFSSAKDDGQAKWLVWGVLTDEQGQMHISLRDFRPFVPRLLAAGEAEMAGRLAQDYLDSYVKGFNRFVNELAKIVTLQHALDPKGLA
ncbi:MAG: hypothetical protein JW850_14085 [Thermoflexales bacterium]|nr:hypothetical protein [Thermoflexales bacterium]